MKKNGIIELFRFLGIAFIMCDHFGQIGLGDLARPFTGTWVYVEFFLILSGFLTAKHFQNKMEDSNTISSYISNGVNYTIKKYCKFLPYVFAAVLIEYAVRFGKYIIIGDFIGFFSKIQEMPFEMLLLSAAGTNGTLTFPLWFLSATFLVSPFICVISQIKNGQVKGIISFYPAVFYYLNRINSIGNHDYPNQIIRALCGMLLGVFVFVITDDIAKRSIRKVTRIIFTICLVSSICILLFINFRGICFTSTYLLCFICIIMLSFCEKTYMRSCTHPFIMYLGKLSMPMFIWHWPVAHLLVLLIPKDQIAVRIVAFYFVTLLISILSMNMVNTVTKRIKASNCRN